MRRVIEVLTAEKREAEVAQRETSLR